MVRDFYPFVDPTNEPEGSEGETGTEEQENDGEVRYATRIAVYDDMLSTPRVIVVEPSDVRTYLEEVTNTVYQTMREQGGRISLMVVRELVENFIHADFTEPIVSILDNGNTIRFSDQGPGIDDKELAFEFGVTSATKEQKRYIRGTGAGLPMVEQYLENAGGAISIEDNIHRGAVVTVSIDPDRVEEIRASVSRGATVRGAKEDGGESQLPSMEQRERHPQGDMRTSVGGWQQGGAIAGWNAGTTNYQQFNHEFSTIQQSPQLPVYSYTYQAPRTDIPEPGQNMSNISVEISERGLLALQFIVEHGSAGPTELAGAYGESTATWSRELAKLSTTGLVVKQGQKRVLTEMGKAWVQQQPR